VKRENKYGRATMYTRLAQVLAVVVVLSSKNRNKEIFYQKGGK